MKEQDFLKHYIQNARHLMWFLGAGTLRSAGLPTATDIIWDLKVKYYCAQENQDVKAHDINNKAIKARIQAFLDSRKSPALGSSEEYSYYFDLVFGDDRAAQQKYEMWGVRGQYGDRWRVEGISGLRLCRTQRRRPRGVPQCHHGSERYT